MANDIRISGAQPAPRSESDIRVNYNDISKIIAASNDIGNFIQAQFYSCDGGANWNQTTLPLAPGDSLHSDPAVDWTSDGTAWAFTIGIAPGLGTTLRGYKSIDGGANWTFDSTPSGTQNNVDREIMWVDHSPTSPFKDQIYVTWHNGIPEFVARRTTGAGAAWQVPVQVSGAETTGQAIGGDIKTNSAGDVFVFWPDDGGSRTIYVAKSTDGGATFGAPINITSISASTRRISIPADSSRQARVYIAGGAYRTATKDLVYAVWPDLKFDISDPTDPGCNSGLGPGNNVGSTCKSRIKFSRSTDGGATWEAPRMLNDQASLDDQFHSRLCVDETNGRLVVIYQDTVNDPGRLKTDVWMQTSSDDGATWSAAEKVTTCQTDETSAGADFSNQYGDYNGLSGYAGTFFPSWTDRRTGVREEIWTAKIQMPIPITQIKVHIETGNQDPDKDTRVYLGFEGRHGREFRMRTTGDPNPFRENTALDIVFGSGANVRDENINDPTNPSMDLTQITGAYIRIEPRQEEPWNIATAQVFINGSATPTFSLKLPNIVLEEDAGEKVSLG
jgi:hypothetical protein